MAHYPCSIDGLRYLGPGNRAYIAILDGREKWEFKPRLCPRHMEAAVELFSAVNGEVIEGVPYTTEMAICLVCARNVAGRLPHSAFMTLYAGREERRDFFAPVCQVCRPQAEIALTALQIES